MEKHHRHSIRLKGFDYSQSGAYFVTIDTFNRDRLFGEIADGIMHPNEFGTIVDKCWHFIKEHFANVELDEFVVMPDHVHGIFFIIDGDDKTNRSVGATHVSPLQNEIRNQTRGSAERNALPEPQSSSQAGPKPHSVGSIVGSFKSAATNQINKIRGEPGLPLWQRNYYEHIIRDDGELNRIRRYIHDNPMNWIPDNEVPLFP